MSETRRIETRTGQTAFVSVGYDPEHPLIPREVFYSGGFREGSDIEYELHDTCVLISMLLQYEEDPERISRSLAIMKSPTGETVWAGRAGVILEELRKPPEWADKAKALRQAESGEGGGQ